MFEKELFLKLNKITWIEDYFLKSDDFDVFLEIYIGANRKRSRNLKFFKNIDLGVLNIDQIFNFIIYVGERVEVWLKSVKTSNIIAAGLMEISELSRENLESEEGRIYLTMADKPIGELIYNYRYSEKNLEKTIIIENDEDLLTKKEEITEEERLALEAKKLEEERNSEALKKIQQKDSIILRTNIFVKNEPFY